MTELRDNEGSARSGADQAPGERRDLEQQRAELFRKAIHDLRTPLAAIALAAQAARRRPECQAAAPGLDRIIRSSARMDAMLTELGTLARLDLAGLRPDQRSVDCAQTVKQVLARLSESLDTGRVRATLPEGLPPVQVDPSHFEQILEALILSAQRAASDEHLLLAANAVAPWVELTVSNQRQGSPAADREVSDRGLFVVRTLVEANGGTVSSDRASVGQTGIRVLLLQSPAAAVNLAQASSGKH